MELAESFGVGRNIIREGIKFLSAKGLLDTGPRKGTSVKSRSDWSILDHEVIKWGIESVHKDPGFINDLFEFRKLLDPIVSQQAALKIKEKQKTVLLEKLEIFEKAIGNSKSRNLAEIDFNQQIYNSTNNRFFSGLYHLVKAMIEESHNTHSFKSSINIRNRRKIVEVIVNEEAADAFEATQDLIKLITN